MLLFYFVKVFPTTARRHTSQEGVGKLVIGKLLGAGIEEQLRIEALGDNTETEYLAQDTVYLKRRACLLGAKTSTEEVNIVVRRTLGYYGQLVLHLGGLF